MTTMFVINCSSVIPVICRRLASGCSGDVNDKMTVGTDIDYLDSVPYRHDHRNNVTYVTWCCALVGEEASFSD
jgi:hypothetical protein